MWATLIGLALAGTLASPAAAEDFTGFYAGVNAGYGWGKDRTDGTRPGAPLPAQAATRDGDGLPPSAARAAARNPALAGGVNGTR
ncbi:hypothetical protein EU555_07800 [Methylobacterium nonmethylotrophicum]|uniref:Porin n=2 Tax=Methylobacterium nonmethylotrophicum TaxID=1141884 RepID=A0A4Z0NTW0_9HYPH|nr:hypothetical protein [Methylobacterium nonmethylotrophicum]TGE00838.1 hypothetical protein EU555_07800 [Methylobacterium nonmethylotrophicum]